MGSGPFVVAVRRGDAEAATGRTGPQGVRCALFGAALVVCAGIYDRDPVLVVGQVVLVAALWPVAATIFQKSGPGAAQRGQKLQ